MMSKKPKEKNSENRPTRRSFLNILWVILGGAALAEFFAVAIAFLRPPKAKAQREDAGALIDAGPVDSFELESVTAFVRGKFYLARLADGGFLALSRHCTHLGCSIPWVEKEKTFACPCHGSAFDITGNVINAPAPRALDIYSLTIENRIVRVDTRKPIKRSTYHIDQVTYPKKV
jgi:cytochrome b6-f complex iron-sulfur subunit